MGAGERHHVGAAPAGLDEAGRDLGEEGAIVDRLARSYACERSELEPAVVRLVAELQREELIVAADPDAASSAHDAAATGGAARAFRAPVLQKFTDMQEMLLLDPIHDVDARGWPHQKSDDGRP